MLPGWMAILIIGREFAVSGLRQHRRRRGVHYQGQRSGQDQNGVPGGGGLLHAARPCGTRRCDTPGMVLMWIVVVFAMLSAISYFRKFWRKVDERIKLGPAPGVADLGAQAAADGNASEAVERIEQLGRGRHNLETAGSELNGSNLAFGPHRAHRLAVQCDGRPAGVA